MARLLVVDDEPNVRYSLEQALRSEALDVISTGTGREGIALVRRDPPDAVLLDLRLPDVSGLDALGEMRRLAPELPVILITAFATAETDSEAARRGAFCVLLKPAALRLIQAAVARALAQGDLAGADLVAAVDARPA